MIKIFKILNLNKKPIFIFVVKKSKISRKKYYNLENMKEFKKIDYII